MAFNLFDNAHKSTIRLWLYLSSKAGEKNGSGERGT
jgi:hypothetical protein